MLSDEQLDEIYALAESLDAWVLSDEAYRWLELPGMPPLARPMRDRGPRAISTGTFSKPFGLPGLRAGWIAARPADAASLAQLSRVFGVTAVPDGMGGFVHNAAIAVIDPGGHLVAILDWDDPGAAAAYVEARLVS